MDKKATQNDFKLTVQHKPAFVTAMVEVGDSAKEIVCLFEYNASFSFEDILEEYSNVFSQEVKSCRRLRALAIELFGEPYDPETDMVRWYMEADATELWMKTRADSLQLKLSWSLL